MEMLAVCRMCLADDVPMRLMENKYLQGMFEKVTEIPFVREDRPVLACYICCARLLNCYKFRNNCLQSEELLRQMLNTNVFTPWKLKQHLNKNMLCVTKVQSLSCSGVDSDNTEVQVEGQSLKFYDVEVKKQITEDENIESSEVQYIEHDSQWSTAEVDPLNEYKYNIPLKTKHIQTCDDVIDENQRPQRVIHSQSHENTSTNNKTELTEEKEERKSHDNITFHYNDDVRESDISSCSYKPLAYNKSKTKHNMNISNNAKRFECDVCNKHFTVKWNLINHFSIHTGEKLYKCNICNKRFNRKSNLHVHMRIHTTDTAFKCDICSECFTNKCSLIKHNRKHTGDKPHKCNICNKGFNQKGHLIIHYRIHTGDKPYKCDTCNKSFTKTNDLVRHKRTHTNDKPYKCEVCSKSFKQKGHLIVHNRIHSGATPYQCNVCNKAFNQSVLLIRHNCINANNKSQEM